MPKVPQYCRQKCAGKSDKAFTRIDGKRQYLGVYGSPESREKYAAILAAPSAKPTLEPSADPTVSELIVAYLNFAASFYGKGSTEHCHFRGAFKTLRKVCGSELARNFGPKLFKEVRKSMIEDQDWARSYVKSNTGRRWTNWASANELERLRKLATCPKGVAKPPELICPTSKLQVHPSSKR